MKTPKATPLIEPYLFFDGRCEEALEFYRTVLGAQVDSIMRYKDRLESLPLGIVPPGYGDKVMHAVFRIAGTTLMASDGCGDTPSFAGFSLSLAVPTVAEADSAFAALSEGGTVKMPLDKTFWSPRFGMLTDRFGLDWMVSVTA